MCGLTTPKGLRKVMHIATASRELKDLILDEKFQQFKDFIRAEHSLFDEIETKHQRELFFFEFIVQGEFPRTIHAEHYLCDDYGSVDAVDVFSVKEVEALENVNDEGFNRFKAFGVEKIEEYLKGVK